MCTSELGTVVQHTCKYEPVLHMSTITAELPIWVSEFSIKLTFLVILR
jgi:hypothetical protein